MDEFLRTIAVIVEVAILFGVFFVMLNGVRLILMDMVIGEEYDKMVKIGFGALEVIILIFLIGHLAWAYPSKVNLSEPIGPPCV